MIQALAEETKTTDRKEVAVNPNNINFNIPIPSSNIQSTRKELSDFVRAEPTKPADRRFVGNYAAEKLMHKYLTSLAIKHASRITAGYVPEQQVQYALEGDYD